MYKLNAVAHVSRSITFSETIHSTVVFRTEHIHKWYKDSNQVIDES